MPADPPPPAPPHPRVGRVVAVCAASHLEGGLGKEPRDAIQVTEHGVPGDYHHGPTRWSQRRKARVTNDRPVTVLAAEAVRGACEDLGIPLLGPGAFGENLLLGGLGDLGDLAAGDRLEIGPPAAEGPAVVLEVTEQNQPCVRLTVRHPGMPQALVGRRGVIALVRREGTVRPGDRVEVRRGGPATPPAADSPGGGSCVPSRASAPRTP